MGHDAHALGGEVWLRPQGHQLVAEILGGHDIQRGERFVHQQRVGLQDECTGEADALPHPTGELLGVGGFEAVQAVQADHVDRVQGALAPLRFADAAGLQAQFDVGLHRQPRHQREGLEHHPDTRVSAVQRCPAVADDAGGGGDESCDGAQQCGTLPSRSGRVGRQLRLRATSG